MATAAPKLTEAQKLRAKQKEARELRASLQQLSNTVLLFIDSLDRTMREPSSPKRGEQVAKLSNQLDMVNDQVRYGALGVDFRTDDKVDVVRRLRESLQK